MLSLGAFREETFSKLQYRHVREDLENNRNPIHLHIESEITKGKYCDYDTFLAPEAVQFLKLYIEQRKKGSKKMSPETLTDESPLIRDETKRTTKGIGPAQVSKSSHAILQSQPHQETQWTNV